MKKEIISMAVLLLTTSFLFAQSNNNKKSCCETKKKDVTCHKTTSEANTTILDTLKTWEEVCLKRPAKETKRRHKLIKEIYIWSNIEKIIELSDGYEYVFYDREKMAPKLLEWATLESLCCPHGNYLISFERFNSSSVGLQIRGSQTLKEGTKRALTDSPEDKEFFERKLVKSNS